MLPILTYKGLWRSFTNTPHLQDGIGTLGDCYAIDNKGSSHPFLYNRDLGSGVKSWLVNCFIYYDNNVWNSTNGLPDQIIALTTSGTGISVTGTYPNFVISNTSPSNVTPSPLTKTDDTNVTVTLTGAPLTALLTSANIALGWTGTLADNKITSSSIWTAKQSALSGTGIVKVTSGTVSYLSSGTSSQFIKADGSLDSTSYITNVLGTSNRVIVTSGTTATVDSPPTSYAPRRITLGTQGFILLAGIGTNATDISRIFPTPLVVDSGRYVHIILQIPVGTATGSQVFRGDVQINGYFE